SASQVAALTAAPPERPSAMAGDPPTTATAPPRHAAGGGGASLGGGGRGTREMFSATCSSCGQEAQVPFQPSGDKPVYCSTCFEQRRGGGARAGGSRYGGGGRGRY